MDCPIYLLADTYIINCCHQSSLICVMWCQSDAVQPSKKLRMHHFCWAAQVWSCVATVATVSKGSWEYWKRVWLQGMKSVLWDLCFRNTHIHTHMRVKAYVPLSFHWLTVFPQVRLLSVWQGSRNSHHSCRDILTGLKSERNRTHPRLRDRSYQCHQHTSWPLGQDICAPVIRWYYLNIWRQNLQRFLQCNQSNLCFLDQYWKIKVYGKLTWSGCLDGICQSILEFACVM